MVEVVERKCSGRRKMEGRNAYCGPADGVLHEAGEEVRVAGRHEPELLESDAVRLLLPAPQTVRADHTVHKHKYLYKNWTLCFSWRIEGSFFLAF